MQLRDLLARFHDLNAQSTRHGARPGPKLAPWCTSGLPACLQPITRKTTHGRRRKACKWPPKKHASTYCSTKLRICGRTKLLDRASETHYYCPALNSSQPRSAAYVPPASELPGANEWRAMCVRRMLSRLDNVPCEETDWPFKITNNARVKTFLVVLRTARVHVSIERVTRRAQCLSDRFLGKYWCPFDPKSPPRWPPRTQRKTRLYIPWLRLASSSVEEHR